MFVLDILCAVLHISRRCFSCCRYSRQADTEKWGKLAGLTRFSTWFDLVLDSCWDCIYCFMIILARSVWRNRTLMQVLCWSYMLYCYQKITDTQPETWYWDWSSLLGFPVSCWMSSKANENYSWRRLFICAMWIMIPSTICDAGCRNLFWWHTK